MKDKVVLIIGDWFIDENWLVAKHNTYNSSHTGDIHYVSQHDNIHMQITSLCGVPEILEVLKAAGESKQLTEDKTPPVIIGMGVWNEADNSILPCILHSQHGCLTPYKITNFMPAAELPPEEKGESLVCPYTRQDCKCITDLITEKRRICPNTGKECEYKTELINLGSAQTSTNRIVRVYEGHAGAEPHLLYRFDWELPLKHVHINQSKLINEIRRIDEKYQIEAIVIEDHNKGVITYENIKYLLEVLIRQIPDKHAKLEKLNAIKWYVRTKVENPDWLQYMIGEGIKIRLRTLDYKIAEKKGPRQWTHKAELGRASLELLGELTGDTKYEDGKLIEEGKIHTDKVAILFDDNTVIAKNKGLCFNLMQPQGPKQLINIGRTTIFFASLVAQDLFSSKDLDDRAFGIQCDYAAGSAYKWSENASEQWKESELNFYTGYKKVLSGIESLNDKKEADLNNMLTEKEIFAKEYDHAWQLWNSSSNELGVIEREKGKDYVFQVWRGEGTLKGYICVGGPKRSSINEMLSSLKTYLEQKQNKYPFNCLLIASPGWGKSYLAHSMADYFKLRYMEFSLSQMATAVDLTECFDVIYSQQNRSNEKLLIFIDEIDCKIEGNDAVGLLLGPIWDGSYTRNGKYYKLNPAVWVFASTSPLEKTIDLNKGADFISRLNGPVITLDSIGFGSKLPISMEDYKKRIILNRKLDEYDGMTLSNPPHIKTEQVYLGVYFLNKNWGPIKKIEKGVLKLFHDMVPINGRRSMEFFVHKFSNIQRGEVKIINLPDFDNYPELKRHILLPDNWKDEIQEKNYRQFVTIETQI